MRTKTLRYLTLLTITALVLTIVACVVPTRPAPCVEEDDPGTCYWDATARGNGLGHSFIHYADGRTVYLP